MVHLNRALNLSKEGKDSRKQLLATKSQIENELRAKEENLRKMAEELKNNILLAAAARSEKQRGLLKQQRALREEAKRAQRELQSREREMTESIFNGLRSIIQVIAQEQGFEFVLEQNASQVILYSKVPFIDITELVIQRYNKTKS